MRKTVKKLTAVGLTLTSVMGLVACGNNNASTESKSTVDWANVEKPEAFTVMVDGTVPQMEEWGDKFDEQLKELTELDFTVTRPDHNSYYDAVANSMLDASAMPDVIILSSDYLALYARQGLLWDMTDAWNNSATKASGRLIADAEKIMQANYVRGVDGEKALYGFVPTRGNGCCTYVKEAWATAAGYTKADLQKQIDDALQKEKELYVFRNQTFSYVVLLMGDHENIQERTKQCVKLLQDILENDQSGLEWIVCASEPVERLSQLPECYKKGMQIFAYRYLGYSHVVSSDMVPVGEHESENSEIKDLVSVDSNVVNPAIFQNFLCNALENEVEEFVDNYLQMVGESALKSKMFRQYILLNIHFCIVSFLQKLGYEKEAADNSLLEASGMSQPLDIDRIEGSISASLKQAIQLREEKSKGKYQNVLQNAVQYMEENFADENLTLNKVACVANVSANHFSAMFSQKMGQTFIEYLTSLRMHRAKELLRCTDKRSGEIALEVGYKDSHYFSFLFKKTQGCTPSEYRNQGAV